MSIELPAGWPEVLRVLVESPVAWLAPSAIAETLELDADLVTDRCDRMVVGGWLDLVEVDPEPVVTLMPDAADRLAVRMERVDGEIRWVATADRPESLQGRHREIPCPLRPDQVLDPYPRADELAEQLEANLAYVAERERLGLKTRSEDLPYPTVILTGSETTWWEWGYSRRGCQVEVRRRRHRAFEPRDHSRTAKPGTFPAPPTSCSCCHLRPLPITHTCLRCSRWGGSEPSKKRTA